jgi:NH3-dependent NAD+ synthetase
MLIQIEKDLLAARAAAAIADEQENESEETRLRAVIKQFKLNKKSTKADVARATEQIKAAATQTTEIKMPFDDIQTVLWALQIAAGVSRYCFL